MSQASAGPARPGSSQAAQIATLVRLSEALSDAETAPDVAATAARIAREELGADFVGVAMADRARGLLRYADLSGLDAPLQQRWRETPLSLRSPGSDAARDGVARAYTSIAEAVADYPEVAEDIAASGLETRIATPLRTPRGVLGSLVLGWHDGSGLTADDRVVVAALARFVAQAMDRARLLQERRDASQILQESMLTRLPQVPDGELAARYLPAARAERIGGDWYDAVVRPDGTVCLMIGDVTGHDIAAAAAMGQLRTMLRIMAFNRDETPAELLTRLDRSAGPLGVPAVATALLMQLSPAEPDGAREVRWSRAGHPAALVVDATGGAVRLGGRPDLLLGVRPQTSRHAHAARLEAGSTVLLFTDGLVERRGRPLSSGIGRLEALLSQGCAAGDPVEVLADHLVEQMVGSEANDDVALVVMRLRSPADWRA